MASRLVDHHVTTRNPVVLVVLSNQHVREIGLALAIICAVLSVAFYDVVFGGKTISPVNYGVMGNVPPYGSMGMPYGYEGKGVDDKYRLDRGASGWQVEPLDHKVHDIFSSLSLPLWNANAGTGMPLLADTQTAPFNILRMPVFIHPGPLSWDFYMLGRYVFAALFAFVFARLLKLSLPAALVVAVGYMISGFFFVFSNNGYLDVYFSVPLVLYAIERITYRASPANGALLAAAVALNLLGGMPESSFVTLVLAGGYALWRIVGTRLEEREGRAALRRLIVLAVGFGAGFAIAMPMLLPFAEYTQNSFSIHTGDRILGLQFNPPKLALTLLVPYINGLPTQPAQGVGWSGMRTYIGMAIALFALLGLWHKPLGARVGWFFLAAGLLVIAKTYGVPLVNDLGRLPLARLTIFVQWLSPLIALCAAVLAGLGVDRVTRGERLGWSLHISAGVLLLVFLGLLFMNRDLITHLPAEPRLWLQLAVGLFAVTWLVLWAGQGNSSPKQGWLCLALISTELLLFAPHGIYRDRLDTFTQPPFVDFLKVQQQTEGRSRIFATDGILYPNDASAFDLDDIRALNALYPERYLTYIRSFVSPTVQDRFVGGPISNEGLPNLTGNPMFDLLGVKYVLSGKSGLHLDTPTPLIDDIVKRLGASQFHERNYWTIDGVGKPVLFAHPPSDIPLDIAVSPQQQVLRFSVSVNPGAWDPGKDSGADGVNFQVLVSAAGGEPKVAWEKFLDPSNRTEHRAWFDGEIDLQPYGSQVKVVLKTLINGNNTYDWAGWGPLRVTAVDEAKQTNEDAAKQYQLVYDKDVQVYRNLNAMPRAIVLHRVEEVTGDKAALARMKRDGFHPAEVAVIEGSLPKDTRRELDAAPAKDGSAVALKDYQDGRVELTARMENTGLILLTDSYYPGWKAYLDGTRVKIYATDYAFRGVIVPAGSHTLVFKYDPTSFKAGVAIAVTAVLGLAAWWGLERRRLVRHAVAPANVVALGEDD